MFSLGSLRVRFFARIRYVWLLHLLLKISFLSRCVFLLHFFLLHIFNDFFLLYTQVPGTRYIFLRAMFFDTRKYIFVFTFVPYSPVCSLFHVGRHADGDDGGDAECGGQGGHRNPPGLI